MTRRRRSPWRARAARTRRCGGWRPLGIAGAVRFVGRVEPAAMPALYDEADIFVNASLVDNQPISVLEAFAAGLPVVSTPTGGIRRDGRGRRDRSPRAAARSGRHGAVAVGALLDDPDRAIAHGAPRAAGRRGATPGRRSATRWAAVYGAERRDDTQPGSSGWAPAEIAGPERARSSASGSSGIGLAADSRTAPMGVLGALAAGSCAGRRSARGCAPAISTARRALLFERFRDAAPARFFAGAVAPGRRRRARAAHAPRTTRRSSAAAESCSPAASTSSAIGGLSFGDPIDWHLDPVSRQAGPARALDRDRPARRRGAGRQQGDLGAQPAPVARAAGPGVPADGRRALRGRASPPGSASGWRANPPGVGINWASSLEVALRLIAWSWALMLFRGSPRARPPSCSSRCCEGVAATPPTSSATSRTTTRRTRI